jgi:hypothetical protein
VEELRRRFEAWTQARLRALAAFGAGRSERLALDAIDDEWTDVAGGEALERARKLAAALSGADARRDAARLVLGLTDACVEGRTREATVELYQREAAQRARVERDEAPVFVWRARQGLDATGERRRALDAALERAAAELAPLREEYFARRSQARAAAGFPDGLAFERERQPGLDAAVWRANLDRLLAATERPWQDGLRLRLARLGVAPGAARRGDVERLLLLPDWDREFAGARALAALERASEALGVRPFELRGVQLDAEPRARKAPDPRCVGVRIPGEIALSLAPRAPFADCEALFALAGRACALAFVAESLPVERRRVSDPALDALWGELWRARLCDPAWIADGPAAARAEEFAAEARWRELGLVRLHAAQARVALELVSLAPGESPHPLVDAFEEEASRALGCAWGRADWLADAREPLASLVWLRARARAAEIAELWRARFERRFWKARRCAELCKELWHTGATYGLDDVARELGLGAPGVDYLLGEVA